jgi:hypothetical protein
VAESAFSLAYDGFALETGKMPVRDIAPALLALGELFSEASKTLHPEWQPVALSIEAGPEQGSFLVRLLLESGDLWNQVSDIFTYKGATALTNLQTLIITPTAGGLLWFIRVRRKQRVLVSHDAPPGHVTITLPDGTTISLPSEVWLLAQRPDILRLAAGVVEPLRRPGVDTLRISQTNSPPLVITEDDLPAFTPPQEDPEAPLLEERRQMILQIVTLTFVGRSKWKLSDGARAIPVTVADEDFLQRVDEGEAFAKGDMLRCDMRIIQTLRPNGALHVDYIVEHVVEHIRRATQMQLGDETEAAD